MKLTFILDHLDSIKTYKDSSFAMMREAVPAVISCFPCSRAILAWKGGETVGFARALELT